MILSKKKGLLNEFQVQIVYLNELCDRLAFYNTIPQNQYEVLKDMLESFKMGVDEYCSQIREDLKTKK